MVMLHLFFIFVSFVCISFDTYNVNKNLESGQNGGKWWPTNKNKGMSFSLVGEKVTSLGRERERKEWVRSLGPNPNPFEWMKERGDPWDHPNRGFFVLKKSIQKCKNEKGNIRTLRGPPFHFYKFDRPSGSESVSEWSGKWMSEVVNEWVSMWLSEVVSE